jgi:hypothetical protein
MPLYSVPRRPFIPTPVRDPEPVNWRRGLFRVWLLISAAWVMGWIINLLMQVMEGGFKTSDILVFPTLLIGPPVAFLIFGIAAGWAFRGFKVDEPPAEE